MRLLKLKTVVVAVDLGDPSRSALRTAARLASLADAQLHLLHVTNRAIASGEAVLREALRTTAPEGPEPQSAHVVDGDAAGAIVERAARVDADVVILGPHRPRAGQDGALGSTASSVVSAAACPCLVIAAEMSLPLERVIAAVDSSEAAGGVLSVALSWASALRPRGGKPRLTALHVASGGEPAGAQVSDAVQRARARAGDASHVEISESVADGSEPAEEILRRAASDSADLLVVGTRGQGVAALGMGSVSAAVARATPCPLLLVPPAVWTEQG